LSRRPRLYQSCSAIEEGEEEKEEEEENEKEEELDNKTHTYTKLPRQSFPLHN